LVLSPYNPDWAKQFEAISLVLKNKLNGNIIGIEHVGSTSVKDLSAKPILDMDIVIPAGIDFNLIKEKLEELGYSHVGDLDVKGREVFKRLKEKKIHHSLLDTIAHNLYACYEDSIELERHILFRDYLRANEVARIAYEKLKEDIVERAGNVRSVYVKMKETEAREFVYSTIEKSIEYFRKEAQ